MKGFGRFTTRFVVNISQEILAQFALILGRVWEGLAL